MRRLIVPSDRPLRLGRRRELRPVALASRPAPPRPGRTDRYRDTASTCCSLRYLSDCPVYASAVAAVRCCGVRTVL